MSYDILINFIPLLQLSTNHNEVKKIIKQPPRGVLKNRCSEIHSKFTGEYPCQSAHGCSPVICCTFSEHLFLRTPLGGCFWWLHYNWAGTQRSVFLLTTLNKYILDSNRKFAYNICYISCCIILWSKLFFANCSWYTRKPGKIKLAISILHNYVFPEYIEDSSHHTATYILHIFSHIFNERRWRRYILVEILLI